MYAVEISDTKHAPDVDFFNGPVEVKRFDLPATLCRRPSFLRAGEPKADARWKTATAIRAAGIIAPLLADSTERFGTVGRVAFSQQASDRNERSGNGVYPPHRSK